MHGDAEPLQASEGSVGCEWSEWAVPFSTDGVDTDGVDAGGLAIPDG